MNRWEEIGRAMREVKAAVERLEKLLQEGCPHLTEARTVYANCRVVHCVDCGAEVRTEVLI